MQKLIPQIKIENFTKFLTSDAMIVAGSAILVAPVLLGSIERLRQKVPFLKDHITIGLVIAAFAISIIAYMLQGKLRLIVLGVAAGVAITALAPFFEATIGKIGGK